MEVPLTPLEICPRAAHLPHGSFFTWQATICDLCFLLHHLPPPRTVWLCHLVNCPSIEGRRLLLHCPFVSWSGLDIIAGTNNGIFCTKEVTSNILLGACKHLAPFGWSHQYLQTSHVASTQVSVCRQSQQPRALSQGAKGKILCQESLSSSLFMALHLS